MLTSNFKTKDIIHPKYKIVITKWKTFPKELSIDESHVGNYLWVAGETKSSKNKMLSYHQPGEYGFPNGGVKVESDTPYPMCLELDEAILHPTLNNEPKVRKKKATTTVKKKPKVKRSGIPTPADSKTKTKKAVAKRKKTSSNTTKRKKRTPRAKV